jgi:hypothetical protein
MSKKANPTPAPADWRAQVAELVKRAQDVLNDPTLEGLAGDDGNGPHAWQLIFEARHTLETNVIALAGRNADTILLPAWSLLIGARDMKGNHRALPAMLEPAIAALEQAFDIASRNLPLPHDDAANAAPEPATPAGEASDEDRLDWREYVGKALAEVSDLADDAIKAADEGSNCWRLLMMAQANHLQFEPEFDNKGTLIDECIELEALFNGAAAVSDASLGVKLICERAVWLMDKAAEVVDRAGIAAAHAS